ncbi:MAG: signal peptidase I [Cyanobacteria bacterium P01_F01_bin.150]
MTPKYSPNPIDPWIAVNLSVIWPGLGQLYSRAIAKGLGFLLTTCSLLYAVGWSLFASEGNTVTGLWLIGVLAILYVFNLFDAYDTIRPLPKPDPREIYQPSQNRWYAIFLSQVLPGFGHLYFQKAAIGGLFLGLGVLTTYLANFYSALLPIPPIIWAIACLHLYWSTSSTPSSRSSLANKGGSASTRSSQKQISRSEQRPTKRYVSSSAVHSWVIVAITVGVLLTRLMVGNIPTWVNQSVLQCIVPSESMVPTLQIDDRIFVKRDPNYRPQTGDLIVFQAPIEAIALIDAHPNTLFVKRIVAKPNQTVEVKHGRVIVNQRPLAETYASLANYDWGPEKVPKDSYFVLGDNRNYSADSHVWGFLPMEDILGKAYKIYWPASRVQSLLK